MARFLTERQREILDFIAEFQEARGISPTHREIRERFGYSSYGTVHKHLKLLEEKGYLRRNWNQKRGVELIRQARRSAGSARSDRSAGSAGSDRSDRSDRSDASSRTSEGEIRERELPFLGLIAAGRPIESVSGHERVPVPPHLLQGPLGDHYVLRVQGDSMIEEGIHDGDLVVVLRREVAAPGEMVVALVSDEVTLKRFFPEGRTIRLQPSHPSMAPIRVPAADVRVQGIVVGLMRKF